MTRRLVLVALALALVAGGSVFVACGLVDRPHGAQHVPVQWREVRFAIGHQKHVGKVACADCHGDAFDKPPAELCTNCHAKTSSLHHDDPTTAAVAPRCTDCHGYSADTTITPWNCMRCHQDDRGHVKAVGAHGDEDCSTCHSPHGEPATRASDCATCHSGRETKHAGLHGCLDCHRMHESKRPTLSERSGSTAASGCDRCHAQQKGKLRVDARALSTGHDACTTCHKPHDFDPQPCASCHRDTKMIAPAKHQCMGCHDQHDTATPRACASCHRESVKHPTTGQGACVGCHRPHEPLAACESCHATTHKHAATTQCLDCHTPHDGKPQPSAALCGTCHTDNARKPAGHAACTTCHQNAAHAPSKQTPACASCHADLARDAGKHAQCASCHVDTHAPATAPPACATCHKPEASSAPRGHAQCASCHSPHAPKKTPACATCHTGEAKTKHGALACATCHRPHGPRGIATPPSCASCHLDRRGATPGPQPVKLHAAKGHADCATCHTSHEARPKDDRATCLACHKAQTNHEPAAARCATCHPFR